MVKNIIKTGLIMGLILPTSTAFAAKKTVPLTAENAIKSIIGEAEGEPQKGRLAVACAIRNRGHLGGVYGVNAPRVRGRKYSDATYKAASEAWAQSARPESCGFIGGADHWENVGAFGKPKWAKGMDVTLKIGNHTFMRPKKSFKK